MPWPGNSPDFNAAEQAWPWLKKTTTARGAPAAATTLKQSWLKAWKELPQEQIQKWIEGIHHNVQEVIRLEGGNEYKEGRASYIRQWKGHRVKGKLSAHSFLGRGDAYTQIQPCTDSEPEGEDEQDEEMWSDDEGADGIL